MGWVGLDFFFFPNLVMVGWIEKTPQSDPIQSMHIPSCYNI